MCFAKIKSFGIIGAVKVSLLTKVIFCNFFKVETAASMGLSLTILAFLSDKTKIVSLFPVKTRSTILWHSKIF